MSKSFYLGIRTVNPLNRREHWKPRSVRNRSERMAAFMLCPRAMAPCRVLMTRIAPREMDSDGLAASFKALRDGVADRLGINDKSPLVEWVYRQRKGNPKQYGIEVQIEETNTA